MDPARPMLQWGPAAMLALPLALALAWPVWADESRSPKPDALKAGTLPVTIGAPHGQRWWDKILRDLPNCMVHTDGCRLCTMKQAGISCSNSPIACQPSEWRCGQASKEPQAAPDKSGPEKSSTETPAKP